MEFMGIYVYLCIYLGIYGGKYGYIWVYMGMYEGKYWYIWARNVPKWPVLGYRHFLAPDHFPYCHGQVLKAKKVPNVILLGGTMQKRGHQSKKTSYGQKLRFF